MAGLDHPDRRVERRQVPEAEEVHLEQAGLLDVPHLPLGPDDVGRLAVDLERDHVLQRAVGDDDAGGVRPDAPGRAFEPEGEVVEAS